MEENQAIDWVENATRENQQEGETGEKDKEQWKGEIR